MVNIKTRFCGVTFENPTILASGILGITASSMIRVAEEGGAGGLTTKSISQKKRYGHKSPIIVEVSEDTLLNAVGLSSPELEEGLKEAKTVLEKTNIPLIVSIYAKSPDEFATLAERISTEIKPHFIEANVSCPNVSGKIIGTESKLAGDVVKKIKNKSNIPLIVKLTPNVSNISEIAKSVEEAGANAISAINTLGPGMAIDIFARKPILGNKFGGLSGASIKPIAVRSVYEIYETVKIPIIGIGGISTGADAIEMLMAGARAVGIGTGIMKKGITVFKKITKEIEDFMKKENYSSIDELIGIAHDSK